MKKTILMAMVVVTMLGLVGCNKEEKDIVDKIQSEETVEGFVPNGTLEDEVENSIEEVIDTANLEKYYDVTQYVGTPRLEKNVFIAQNVEKATTSYLGDGIYITQQYDERLKGGSYCDCIVVDNGTDTNTDDIVVYVFIK